jgi:ferredoxin/flavodoxin---NADP+ reductase
VIDPETKRAVTGVYATGWIKRGPSGVIGTNKPDSVETVVSMLEDVGASKHWQPSRPEPAAAEALVQARQPLFVTYADWKRLDALELERGKAYGRPRLKFTTVDEMMAALGRTVPAR